MRIARFSHGSGGGCAGQVPSFNPPRMTKIGPLHPGFERPPDHDIARMHTFGLAHLMALQDAKEQAGIVSRRSSRLRPRLRACKVRHCFARAASPGSLLPQRAGAGRRQSPVPSRFGHFQMPGNEGRKATDSQAVSCPQRVVADDPRPISSRWSTPDRFQPSRVRLSAVGKALALRGAGAVRTQRVRTRCGPRPGPENTSGCLSSARSASPVSFLPEKRRHLPHQPPGSGQGQGFAR